MPTFRHTIDIDATPDQVWQVLGEVTSVDRWIPGVIAVERTDDGRLCTFEDGHVQRERIVDHSPETRSYGYEIDGAPLPVRDNVGTFAVTERDGGARVEWSSSFVALDAEQEAELAQMWEPYLPWVLSNLKSVVEAT